MQFNCAYTELVSVSKLVPNPKNANKHSTEQIERLAKIIDFQGQRSPIVVSKRSGFITKGHGRLMAMQKLGWENVAVDYQDYLSEAQEYADVIADNEIARWAELDREMLNIEIKNLDIDLDLLGILDFKIEPLIEVLEPQSDEDEVPEVIHPITRRGDIWLLGNHRLMCGDSTMIDDVDKLMNGEKADMVFTDPPYGVSYKSNKSDRFEVIKNDDQFLDFNPILEAFMKPDSAAIIWTSHSVYPIWREMFSDKYKSTVIWNKNGGAMGDLAGDYMITYEMGLFCTSGKPKFKTKRPSAVWDIKKDNGADYVHPTQKPVALAEHGMDHFIGDSNIVMDLFLGSGSTLIAAQKTNRICYGMELDEKYCDVIINRWQNYTGKKATLELTGQTYEELKAERENVG